jgi:hypothetical protein
MTVKVPSGLVVALYILGGFSASLTKTSTKTPLSLRVKGWPPLTILPLTLEPPPPEHPVERPTARNRRVPMRVRMGG